MGLVTGIAKLARSAYRYIKYGKQVGKTAKNGLTVHQKGRYTTGVDAKGKVTYRQRSSEQVYKTSSGRPYEAYRHTSVFKQNQNGSSIKTSIQTHWQEGGKVEHFRTTETFDKRGISTSKSSVDYVKKAGNSVWTKR